MHVLFFPWASNASDNNGSMSFSASIYLFKYALGPVETVFELIT